MNPRKRDLAQVRQNRFTKKQDQQQQKMINESKEFDKKIQNDGSLRASTLVQGVSVCLYAYGYFYASSAIPRANAASEKPLIMNSGRDIEVSDHNVTDSKPEETRLPTIKQSDAARSLYTKSDFEKNKAVLSNIIQKVRSNNPEADCRAQSVFSNPSFHLLFQDKNELTYGSNAEYDSFKNSANFASNSMFDKNEKIQNELNFIHEVLAHAFVREQNRLLNSNRQPHAIPYLSLAEKKAFKNAIDSGLKELEYQLKLFNKKPNQMSQVDKIKLDQLKKAGLNYDPALELLAGYGFSEDQIIALIRSGNVDKKTYQLKKPIKLLDDEISIYCHAFKKAEDGKYYCYTNVYDGVSNKAKVALLELLNDLKKIEFANLPAEKADAERDAYIQEHLIAYPDVFSSIFSELLEYHHQRGDEKYKACIQIKKT